MAETAASIVAEQVAAPAASWIKRQLSYVFNFKSHVENSNDVVRRLKLQRERIECDADCARRRLEVIHRDVDDWLERATTVDENTEHLLEETESAKKGCFFGLCPNVKARYQVSKKAEKVSKAAADLLLQGEFPRLSYRSAPQGLRFAPIQDYETFKSRARLFEEIVEALKNPNVSMIGVWGMGGVGKTTLVKKAAEQANVDKVFDVVIFSEVSLNQDLRRIQGEISDALHFKFEAETIVGRSNELRERLRKEKKILVILDNIWASLDLEELGIPFGDDHKECKILMTSRDGQVLTRMGINNLNIRVDALDDGEAGNLFEKMAGEVVKARNLQPLAIEIAKRCAGLPILIVTVARALGNRNDLHTWKVALRQLEKFESKEFDEKVYSTLELSYNHLKSDLIKQLFLLCGLLVNTDYAIEDLFIYCMSLDSFKDLGCLEDRRDELHKSIKDLVSSCLLLDGQKNGYIKMHDVVRKFAVSYARQKHNMFMEEYDAELEEWPKRNTDVKFSSICFPCNYIHRLLEGLECRELKLFILHSKNRNLKIPSSFFNGLGGIIVLDIKNIVLPSLPSSFRCLEKLRTLSLEECELEDTTMIGELVGLEVLRFVNTYITHVPEKIRQLTGLKLLCVSKCFNLKRIPQNVISSLTQLEELYVDESFVNWQAEGDNSQNACLAELKKLFKLTSLNIHIPNSNIMPNDLFSDKLERFKILIGDGWDWHWSSKYETSRRLKLKLPISNHLRRDVNELLKKTEDLYLDELGGVNSVCELDKEGRFPRLRCLHVQRGSNFQYIVNSNTMVPSIFPNLEVLALTKLINLEMICLGQLGVESFSKLRTMKVERCDKLKNIFSFTIAKSQLLQLQEIEVENCENMEEIFSCESEKDGKCDIVIELKQVHSLCLKFLPKITSFCSEVKLQTRDSSESSQNVQLIPLLNGKILFPNLENLVLYSIGAEKIWDNSLLAMPRCFKALRDLEVWGCNKLKFLFPVGVVTSLIQLKELWVKDCELMEGIIEGGTGSMIFHKLCRLDLQVLPKLKRFCTENSIEFPSLSHMRIEGCPELKSFIFDEKEVSNDDLLPPLFDEKILFPNLENLVLSSIGAEKIWDNSLLAMPHCSEALRDLEVQGCNKLKFLFPVGVVTSLIQLKKLRVEGCDLMEGIIEGGTGSMIFPKLEWLHLQDLPKLKRFCTGNSIKFPSLSYMWISTCPKLKSFIFDEKEVANDDLPPPLFDEKVELPTIERLAIWSVNLERIWHNELAPESFCKLDDLYLSDCENLLNIFPSNMLTRLQNLQKLQIYRCESMDVIFDLEGPNALEIHITKLKSLTIRGCPSLKIFASQCRNVQEGANGEYLEKEILANLEQLSLSWNYAMKEMWHGEFRFEVFCRLKTLTLNDFHDEIITSFPPGFFKKLPNLEKLNVRNSAFSEIFPNGGVIGEAGELSTFCTLKTLNLVGCDRLKILFPSSLLSFCNLITMDVSSCNGLTYLMSSSTAKSMMQLQELEVWRCDMMKSIVECVGEGEAEDDIIFPQLKELKIYYMPNLSSFCGSEKLAFKLPSLEEVTVKSSPNLKTFCEGPLSTFKLQSVTASLFPNEKCWNGDLNTTIQTLYKEMKMTTRIQRQFRRHVARRDFIELRMASIVIQSAVRGNKARKIFKSLKGDIALN